MDGPRLYLPQFEVFQLHPRQLDGAAESVRFQVLDVVHRDVRLHLEGQPAGNFDGHRDVEPLNQLGEVDVLEAEVDLDVVEYRLLPQSRRRPLDDGRLQADERRADEPRRDVRAAGARRVADVEVVAPAVGQHLHAQRLPSEKTLDGPVALAGRLNLAVLDGQPQFRAAGHGAGLDRHPPARGQFVEAELFRGDVERHVRGVAAKIELARNGK